VNCRKVTLKVSGKWEQITLMSMVMRSEITLLFLHPCREDRLLCDV
jgi:hypothetical protein